ncbi:unnamed protein product [Clavelina lepadiformis]|uniref:Glucanase n=1 Tax=Clavelina lepadiformis TaxID=159417 RepID=A0ABP0FGZ5_CLALP
MSRKKVRIFQVAMMVTCFVIIILIITISLVSMNSTKNGNVTTTSSHEYSGQLSSNQSAYTSIPEQTTKYNKEEQFSFTSSHEYSGQLSSNQSAYTSIPEQTTKYNKEEQFSFTCPHIYNTVLGRSELTVTKTLDANSGLQVTRNGFWLLGVDDDFYTIRQIKQAACNEDSIPVIVISMHPTLGLSVDEEGVHYLHDRHVDTWEEYDKRMQKYSRELDEVPAIIVMEPSLLMHTFNSKTEYHSHEYQLAFTTRVQNATQLFPRAWVYVDAGNAMYLQWQVNLDHIIRVMRHMPPTIRGFSINVASFVNSSFNDLLASAIHCETGLHYIIDTSRNGGQFSSRSLDEINQCTYDPPTVKNGSIPSWGPGAKVGIVTRAVLNEELDIEEDAASDDPVEKKKRWVLGSDNGGDAIYNADSPAAGGVSPEQPEGGGGGGGDATYDLSYGYEYDNYEEGGYSLQRAVCVTTEESGLDAYAWVKTPGESDGRLFTVGTYHPCLLDHFQECSDRCPQYVPKRRGEFQRLEQCECS